ncbi:MAG: tail fiber domain-containing protein [Bacteroidota bacterium]
MKKSKIIHLLKLTILFIALSCNIKIVNGQATTAVGTNLPGGLADFIGWQILAPPIPLTIKTELRQPLNFHTFAGGAGLANMRMQIYDVTGGAFNSGFIGIGNCNAFLPQSLVHQNIADTMNYHQFTLTPYTGGGISPREGFQIGDRFNSYPLFDHNGPAFPCPVAELRQWQNAPIDFFSNDVSAPVELPLRMRITYGLGGDKLGNVGTTPGVTKINISHMGTTGGATNFVKFWPLTDGVAMLNLGENQIAGPGAAFSPYLGGARNWMDVGTHYSYDTDDMYVGLKDNGVNQKDAVITWGDDPSHDSQPANHLLYIFTATGTPSWSGGANGLEVARMVAPSGDFGMMGIGGDPTISVPYTNLYTAGAEPGNTLEVNSSDQNSASTIGGSSGLRFTDLNTISKPTVNPGKGILSVNSSGDVIYVEDIGNYCSETPQRPLRADFEVPLYDGVNGYDYFFSGQSKGKTDVIVGSNCSNLLYPYAKFQSFQATNQTGESNAGFFYNSTNDRPAIGAVGRSDASQYTNIGIKGYAKEYRGVDNVGVFGTTANAAGFLGLNLNCGVYGYANMRPHPTSTHVNYAVVGDLGVTCPTCTTGAAGGFGDFAGYFNGDLFTTAGFYVPSDSTLKENIQDITDPMDILNALNPKSYTFKQQQNESMKFPDGTHYGIFAQNVASVLPFAVKDCVHPARLDSLGNVTHQEIDFLGVNNIELIPFLVAAVKDQQQTINAMQAQLDNCCNAGNRTINPHHGEEEQGNSVEVELKNANAIILNQNVPNPFAEQTTISFFLTDDVKKAQIFFYDSKGVIIKIVDLNEKGSGQLNVFAADLSSGNYTYTLIADGKLIETKKMVKQ